MSIVLECSIDQNINRTLKLWTFQKKRTLQNKFKLWTVKKRGKPRTLHQNQCDENTGAKTGVPENQLTRHVYLNMIKSIQYKQKM